MKYPHQLLPECSIVNYRLIYATSIIAELNTYIRCFCVIELIIKDLILRTLSDTSRDSFVLYKSSLELFAFYGSHFSRERLICMKAAYNLYKLRCPEVLKLM